MEMTLLKAIVLAPVFAFALSASNPTLSFAQGSGTSTGGMDASLADLKKIADCGASKTEYASLTSCLHYVSIGEIGAAEQYLGAFKSSAFRYNTWRTKELKICYERLEKIIFDEKTRINTPALPPEVRKNSG